MSEATALALEVQYQRCVGPLGFTILDPLTAELLFWSRWRRAAVTLKPCPRPVDWHLGPLPAATRGDETVPRARVLDAIAAAGERGLPEVLPSETDAIYCAMVRHRVGSALRALLFGDFGTWDDYTRPTLVRSAPWGRGLYFAWQERRRQLSGLSLAAAADVHAAALLALEGALTALVERLGTSDAFGCRGGQQGSIESLTPLDACAYGHLAVLFSIPCESGSRLHGLLRRFATLACFCERVEQWLGGVWPSADAFLAGLPPGERIAGASGTANSTARGTSAVAGATGGGEGTAGTAAPLTRRRLLWWELWGWSWGLGRLQDAIPKVRKASPPQWYLRGFVATCGVVVLGAVATGCSPIPAPKLLALLAQWLQTQDTDDGDDDAEDDGQLEDDGSRGGEGGSE